MLVHLVKVRLISLNEDLMKLLQEIETNERFLKSNELISKKLVHVISHGDGLRNSRDSCNMMSSEKIASKGKEYVKNKRRKYIPVLKYIIFQSRIFSASTICW